MRKEASLDQWKELYDATLKLKALEPWKYLDSTDHDGSVLYYMVFR